MKSGRLPSPASDLGQAATAMNKALVEQYRCPQNLFEFHKVRELSSSEPGYFLFGPNVVCYGQCSSGVSRNVSTGGLPNALSDVFLNGDGLRLPFDPTQVVENLRLERYATGSRLDSKQGWQSSVLRRAYYLFRPLLPVFIRKHLQRYYLRDWDQISFPHWPLDKTVERVFERLLLLAMEYHKVDRIPFIWFWPEGRSSCAIITHDVETQAGKDFCASLMDLDDAFGIKASFQIVPERRYPLDTSYLESIRKRGFEVNVQDLSHDGRLFASRKEFLLRAKRINEYGRRYGAKGFRSSQLYRNPDWLNHLEFSYDMSIPNTGRLEPQRGGCCTVMPYFIGDILELPVTTTQDYALFNILGSSSIDLWKEQTRLICEDHGLASFIVHPDYVRSESRQRIYKQLLAHLTSLRTEKMLWIALPNEVNEWWRARKQMKLLRGAKSWTIQGPGSERARVAYAVRDNRGIRYEIEKSTATHSDPLA